MLQHLVDLADRLEERGDLIPLGYREMSRNIDWVIEIDDGKGEGRVREASASTPRPNRKRTSAIRPQLLADYAYYVLEIPEEGKEDRAEKAHTAFKDLLGDAAEATEDPLTESALRVLANEQLSGVDPSKVDPKDVVTFTDSEGQFLFDRPDVRAFWQGFVSESFTSEVEGTCSVCGSERLLLQTLPEDVSLMGETPQLTSFNKSAFESYGKEQTLNASICYPCGARAAQALNYLTGHQNHKVRLVSNPREGASASLKDELAVFWSEADAVETEDGQPVDLTQAIQAGFDAPSADEEESASIEEIEQLLSVPWTSQASALDVDDAGVHLVVLSPNKARLVIREWLHEDLNSLRKNLRTFLETTSVETSYGEPGLPLGVRDLLGALSVNGVDPDSGEIRSRREVEANLVRRLLRTAYAGDPPPRELTSTVVRTLRNPSVWSIGWLTQSLVSILHLSRFDWNHGDDDTMSQATTTLETDRSDPGYLCGRLMAVLEATQQRAADGDLNTTIVDRNYNAAATAPGSTIPRLLTQAESAHIPKIRKNRGKSTAEGIRNDIEEILGGLEEFPKTLDTDGQGDFALGFYHQRAAIRRAKREYYESNQDESTEETV